MKLTPDQREKVTKAIHNFGLSFRPCPVCAQTQWIVAESIYELREFEGGNLTVGGPIYPVIAILCNICSNTILLNALRLGVIQQSPFTSLPRTLTPPPGKEGQ